jgi:D-alanyl-D-alanine carboxypeptidase (penicillin-binding protein 5/6)
LDNASINESYYQYLQTADLNGKYVMVYNKTANQIIYQKDVDTMCYPASTTKLLTAVVALEYISPETIFTVGSELDLVPSGSSLAYLGKGERISLNDLLYGLMLPSGNDAGYTIAVNVARTVSGDSTLSDQEAVEYFADLMNLVAQKVGMVDSHFVVPDGFHDDKHYVTARDMLKLLLYTDNYPLIRQVTSTYRYDVTVESGQDYIWLNSNRLIDTTSEFYYEGVSTGKTGFHDDAGHCMAFTCEKNGIELYVVIMDADTAVYRNRDALNLLNMVYSPLDIKVGEAWDIDPNETTAEVSSEVATDTDTDVSN